MSGHSTGGGEVARYIARHGTRRVAKAVLIGAVPPLMLKTPNKTRSCRSRCSMICRRQHRWPIAPSSGWSSSVPFYGYNKPGAKVSEGVKQSFWLQGMMCGFPASYFSVKAFSETDQTDDLKKINMPTLILHGDADQIVPFADAGALRQSW